MTLMLGGARMWGHCVSLPPRGPSSPGTAHVAAGLTYRRTTHRFLRRVSLSRDLAVPSHAVSMSRIVPPATARAFARERRRSEPGLAPVEHTLPVGLEAQGF